MDTLKIQDLEVDNNKLREEMKKIRKSIAESSDVDNNEAVREMAEQYETLQVNLRLYDCIDSIKMQTQCREVDNFSFIFLIIGRI